VREAVVFIRRRRWNLFNWWNLAIYRSSSPLYIYVDKSRIKKNFFFVDEHSLQSKSRSMIKKVLPLSNDWAINLNFIYIIFFLIVVQCHAYFHSRHISFCSFFVCSFVPMKKREWKRKYHRLLSGSTCIQTQKKNEKMGCLSHVKLTTGVYDTTGSFLSMFLWHFLQRKRRSYSFFSFMHFLFLLLTK
jgi:hypothetical protein